jgi:hypothetical protein
METHELGIALERMPERLRGLLAPDAPESRKMMVARAALPLPPAELIPALAYLTNEKNADLRDAARQSLSEMPRGTLLPVLASDTTDPGVLDRLTRVFVNEDDCLQQLVINRATPDQTFVFLGRHGAGSILDAIALNQARLMRTPTIVQAIYFNPKAKMSTVSRVMEFAVRENLPIQHMPGYKEIVAAVYGDASMSRPMGGADAEAEAPPEPAAAAPDAASLASSPEDLLEEAFAEDFDEDDDIEMFQSETDLMDELLGAHATSDDDFGAFLGEDTSPGLEDQTDDAFFAVLAAAMEEDGDEADEAKSGFVSDQIRDMNISQRIRLALMGNSSAREILIKDANKLVCTAVMRNPGLNDREVLAIASNRNVAADVLRIIANGREWTRNYGVKKALIINPKTPPAFAIQFLKHLRERDLKDVSKNRDVSPTIARLAKRLGDERAKKK